MRISLCGHHSFMSCSYASGGRPLQSMKYSRRSTPRSSSKQHICLHGSKRWRRFRQIQRFLQGNCWSGWRTEIVETAGGVKGCTKRFSADVPYFYRCRSESTFPVPLKDPARLRQKECSTQTRRISTNRRRHNRMETAVKNSRHSLSCLLFFYYMRRKWESSSPLLSNVHHKSPVQFYVWTRLLLIFAVYYPLTISA